MSSTWPRNHRFDAFAKKPRPPKTSSMYFPVMRLRTAGLADVLSTIPLPPCFGASERERGTMRVSTITILIPEV